ncbi:hypothetical protein ACWD25_38935 [Streptomyces sp. NPDC002920]
MTASDESPAAVVTRYLVVADVAHQYSVAPTPDAPQIVAELAAQTGNEARALEYLRSEDTVTRNVSLFGPIGRTGTLAPPPAPVGVWGPNEFTAAFFAYLREATGAWQEEHSSLRVDLSHLGPEMLLRTHTADAQPYTEVLMCARVRTSGVLFVRVAQFDHAHETPLSDLVAQAFEHSTAMQDRVRMESDGFVEYEDGIEIEQKITLLDEASIWSLTKGMWAAVENGDFPGFITDPGYELTRWHLVQHNFEVLAPADKSGHYAFQQRPNGKYHLKMKTFPEDALRRKEAFRWDVDVPGADFEGYLAREFPDLRFKKLPTFRRTRFDLNIQSVVTGHYFGIETDEVTISHTGGRKLRQVEIEYLKTRWHAGMDASSIDAEMNRLTELLRTFIAKQGIGAERSFYSKLSFLRDSLDEQATVRSGS